MTKKTTENTETTTTKLESREIILSDGRKVTINEPTTPQVRKARDLAANHPADVYIYLASECCLFNGNQISADEIDNLRSRDYLYIEACVRELIGEKN